jgi:hypothetical protein
LLSVFFILLLSLNFLFVNEKRKMGLQANERRMMALLASHVVGRRVAVDPAPLRVEWIDGGEKAKKAALPSLSGRLVWVHRGVPALLYVFCIRATNL